MTSERLGQAITLIKAGDKQAALPILKEVLQANPQDENAWLWLYSCVDDVEQKKACLQKALQINPHNLHAHTALRKLMELPLQPASAKAVKLKPASQGNRPYWLVGLGGLLLTLFITVFAIYLLESGQISAWTAAVPLSSPVSSPSLINVAVTPSTTAVETATPFPSPTPGQPEIVQLQALESYRMQGTMTMDGGFVSDSLTWSFTQEWVKASLSQHTIISIQEMKSVSDTITPTEFPATSMETIAIDRTTWIKGEDDWIQIDSNSRNQQNGVPGPVSDWRDLKLVGEEIINGIHCIHYIVDEDTMKISGLNEHQDVTTHALGDIWVANQTGLPSVILRMKIQMQVSGFFSSSSMLVTPDPLMESLPEESADKDVTYSYEYDVTDVNSTIIIEPPKKSP